MSRLVESSRENRHNELKRGMYVPGPQSGSKPGLNMCLKPGGEETPREERPKGEWSESHYH